MHYGAATAESGRSTAGTTSVVLLIDDDNDDGSLILPGRRTTRAAQAELSAPLAYRA